MDIYIYICVDLWTAVNVEQIYTFTLPFAGYLCWKTIPIDKGADRRDTLIEHDWFKYGIYINIKIISSFILFLINFHCPDEWIYIIQKHFPKIKIYYTEMINLKISKAWSDSIAARHHYMFVNYTFHKHSFEIITE